MRAPEPERVMLSPPLPVAVTPPVFVEPEIIPNSKDEAKSIEVSIEEPKPQSNCVWEGFNIDEKISDKLKTSSSKQGVSKQ